MTKFGKIIILIILIVVGVSAYFLYSSKDPVEGVDSFVTESDSGFSYDEENDFYSIKMKYPKDSVVVADAELFVFSKIGDFKKIFDDFDEEDWEVFRSSAAGKYSLGMDYRKKVSDVGITTYIFDTHEYTGGAHGNQDIKTFSYDSLGGRIEIKDLLKSDNQNLAAVASVAQAALIGTVEGGVESLFLDGFLPEYENYSNFYFENEKLVFVFPPYQAGPYVLGALEAELPLGEVFGYLKKKYVPGVYEELEKKHRGFVVYGAEVRSFRECDGDKEYWYQDTTGSLQDEYLHAKRSEDPYEEVPAILNGYYRGIPDSEEGFSDQYDGYFVVSDLSQVGGGGVCE